MKKIIKQYGSSSVIILTKEECKIYDINVGDVVDVELVKIKSKKN